MTEGECYYVDNPWAYTLTWLLVGGLQFTKYVLTSRLTTEAKSRQENVQEIDWKSAAKDFWRGFFLMLHWGILGPIVNRFLVPFQFCWNTSCIL